MAFDPAQNILRTNAGDPVPQVWDDALQVFVAYEGAVEVDNPTGESLDVQVTGSNAAVHESLTVDASVGGVSFANYATNIYAFITAETAQMRFTVDGTDPTTTVGHLLNPGDILELDSLADITAFKAIRTGSVSGVLKATYSGVA